MRRTLPVSFDASRPRLRDGPADESVPWVTAYFEKNPRLYVKLQNADLAWFIDVKMSLSLEAWIIASSPYRDMQVRALAKAFVRIIRLFVSRI